MFIRTIGLLAGYALVADSFMIPSTISLPHSYNKLSGWPSFDVTSLGEGQIHSRIIKLDCDQCEFPVSGKHGSWTTDVPNSLVFEFTVSEDGKAVSLNNEQIYPLDHAVQLKAPQVASDVDEKLLYTSLDEYITTPRRLDFALGSRTIEAADGTDAQLVDIDFRIFGIDGTSNDLGALSIRLLRDEDGSITIADVVKVPVRDVPSFNQMKPGMDETVEILPTKHGKHQSNPVCNGPAGFLCRWVELVESKVGAMRGRLSHQHRPGRRPCRGSAGRHGIFTKGGKPKFMGWKYNHKPAHMDDGIDFDGHDLHDMMHHAPESSSPHHHRHHRGPPTTLRRFARGLRHFVVGFVVPILVGVAAGMTASLLGMVVGTFIAWFWIKFVRGGRRSDQTSTAASPDDEFVHGSETEKAGLLGVSAIEEVECAPPVYAEKE